MRKLLTRCSGRADPFGLLVLAVMLALTVTIGIQAQASTSGAKSSWFAAEMVCPYPCNRDDGRQ